MKVGRTDTPDPGGNGRQGLAKRPCLTVAARTWEIPGAARRGRPSACPLDKSSRRRHNQSRSSWAKPPSRRRRQEQEGAGRRTMKEGPKTRCRRSRRQRESQPGGSGGGRTPMALDGGPRLRPLPKRFANGGQIDGVAAGSRAKRPSIDGGPDATCAADRHQDGRLTFWRLRGARPSGRMGRVRVGFGLLRKRRGRPQPLPARPVDYTWAELTDTLSLPTRTSGCTFS